MPFSLSWRWVPSKTSISASHLANIDPQPDLLAKKRKRKRKHSLEAEPVETSPPSLSVTEDAIFAASKSSSTQSLDYPQHAGSVPLLRSVLALLQDVTPAFSTTAAVEQLAACSSGQLALGAPVLEQPSLWAVPFRNPTCLPKIIKCAGAQWLIPPFSAALMVRPIIHGHAGGDVVHPLA